MKRELVEYKIEENSIEDIIYYNNFISFLIKDFLEEVMKDE